ncbi:2-keto-3-deoxy-D-arabino-heptulosonate-7- phosphate synthase II [Liberibacter crescens BT-1]|uniref:Phospho-2-dehydro-3-deoxyheptonate aldolase n=1 Tax=Liberibacter crescens (strain BT-1) TaxID=1215343 RepID=L0EVN1_LIBCB|nr:3-deoxy-7-phosphoheptulonate synthase class II [Liberibacter crescens]AGA64728.1 2-keto-3-deoxy-D-arabino-heptulosonate-7- phosphate synthase II [Liberibacter crescens BT-1]AMC12813.1 phospho-2-dehydro-3-deoxyheptonate aldolase [Liberibacter crescens]
MLRAWDSSTWRGKPIKQFPEYDDLKALKSVEDEIKGYLPIVLPQEIDLLKKFLADVSEGKRFLFQGGDCAESFSDNSTDTILDFFQVFLQIALVLSFGSQKPILKIGRIAGQFAKPRSLDFEQIGDKKLPSYRGDIVNDINFKETSRIANPQRQITAYLQSVATLSLLRSFSMGKYSTLKNAHQGIVNFIQGSPRNERCHKIASKITETLGFMNAIGVNSESNPILNEKEFFTSHEALLLNYEEALTRMDPVSGSWYATSGHMLWIGDRTRQIDHAHVEYCRGIKNPVGLKCSSSLSCDQLLQLIDVLNPDNEPGRLTLICRFGYDKVEQHLTRLIRCVEKEGRKVVWSCDPMHGNTIKVNGYKTRPFDYILSEIESFFKVHFFEGTVAGGVHIEMTGQDVTECIGGTKRISEEDLSDRYYTFCDPRLNANQAIELTFLIAECLIEQRYKRKT